MVELREVFAGRPVVLVGGPAAGATQRVAQLRSIGVERCLVVASNPGMGPQPDDTEVVFYELEPFADPVAEFRAEERAFASPPPEALAAIERFDPTGTAIVLAPPFFDVRTFGPRPIFGARRREWVALEDKTQADELFDAAGVAHPSAEIVAAVPDELAAAAARMNQGAGTVWAADARDGFNGGGFGVRWICDAADRAEAVAAVVVKSDRVRVAPFVEGIPCSVHGFVTGDGVAAFRPVELITLRAPAAPRLHYAGCATFFDPPAADREEMRAAVRRVGETLRERVDFRGAFTIDGVLSADGWLATECNPRFGAALGYVAKAAPELSFPILHHAVVAGVADASAADLEAAVVPAADANRWGGAWTTIAKEFAETVAVEFDDPRGTLSYGPSGVGGFVRFELPNDTPSGPSVAPVAVAAFARADQELGLGIGPRVPAAQVR
jgi:hypothetical protein